MIFIKIQGELNRASKTSKTQETDNKKIYSGGGSNFRDNLKDSENQNCEERIRNLIDKILKQGEKLGEKVDIRDLKIYKKLIAEFLDEAVGNSLKFSKDSFLDRRGRYRAYTAIKKINNELDLLTKEVLNNEKDNIKILGKLEDIRGLILDMIL